MSSATVVDIVFSDLASLDLSNRAPQVLSRLTEYDRLRHASIRRPQRQIQFLAGRLLALEGEERGLSPYRGEEALPARLNISHTRNWAACAFSSRSTVGLDIEQIRPRAIEALAAAVCSPTERLELARCADSDRKQLFYRYWTAKEAFAKACRLGLALDLFALDVSLNSRCLFYPNGIAPGSSFVGQSAALRPDLAAAVVLKSERKAEVSWRWWLRCGPVGQWQAFAPALVTDLAGETLGPAGGPAI